MFMIKPIGRFFLLLLICLLLVYAPEITAGVSGPYAIRESQRVLLRIALCCEDEPAASSIYKSISAYQKAYPAVHLRITRISEERLPAMSPPYPDVFLIHRALAAQVPTDAALYDSAQITCAVCSASPERETAESLAAYLYEANPPGSTPADF